MFGVMVARRFARSFFGRKSLPEAFAAPYAVFVEQVARMEEARSALMSCLPVGRVDPAPVPVGLDLLDETLVEIRADLGDWQVPELAKEWQLCLEAIDESRGNMPRAHQVARSTGELEELLGAVEDVDEPLGYAFKQAELRWRTLKT